jgi:excisionase family DNA binding protein
VLTTALAAELLQVHAESLRKMVREGRIPCHRLAGGRGMRFLRDELLEWLGAQPAVPLVARVSPGAVSAGGDVTTPRAPNAAR